MKKLNKNIERAIKDCMALKEALQSCNSKDRFDLAIAYLEALKILRALLAFYK